MKKLNITPKDRARLTDAQKVVAQKLGMKWNPLGNPEIFRSLQENILKYFLGLEHQLDEREVLIVDTEHSNELVINPPEEVVEVVNNE